MLRLRSFTAAMAVLLVASPLAAQSVSRDTLAIGITPTAAPVVTHAARDSLALLSVTWAPAWTVDAHANAGDALAPRIVGPRSSESSAMMIVGGAALLVGAVVSGRPGTIIMVSGAVVGLVGLWRYVR